MDIYKKLLALCPGLLQMEAGDSAISVVPGFMDLNLDIIEKQPGKMKIALSHYYEADGDMIPDPDMEIAISIDGKIAMALSLTMPNTSISTDHNEFLSAWLTNCIGQGHLLEKEE
jgi:uncharacterized protein YqiB (DUF1249 family)